MPYYYRSKRRSRKKRAIKVYSTIVVVCFVTAAALTFVMEKANALIDRFDRIPWEQLDGISVEKVKKVYGGKIEDADLEKLIKTYKQNVDTGQIKKLKKAYEGRIDAKDLGKVREL